MQPLVDFINHGLLPFTGRDAELRRLVAFWRETVEADRLRAIVLVGEAGIGKSRLMEEAIRSIVDDGGAVVHLRLHPEATTSVAPLLAHAMWHSGAGRRLLTSEPEGTIPSVAAAMRRMCRLRPTLLAIDNTHLMSSDSLAELKTFAGMLSEENLSLLLSTRPVEEGRHALDRFVVEEMQLVGLHGDALTALWELLFESSSDEETVGLLGGATLGNPLAIRSALRGSIASGAISRGEHDPTWRVTVPLPSLSGGLKRYVRLLADGMAAHLDPAERDAARRLSSLGELFSREAAEVVLAEGGGMIDALLFKGVLATSTPVYAPLRGTSTPTPLLSFAHTLLHQQFTDRLEPDVDRLIDLVASTVPIYSVVPLQMIAAHAGRATRDREVIEQAIDAAMVVAVTVDYTPHWSLAESAWNAASRLFELHSTRWPTIDRLELEARMSAQRLALLRRRNHEQEYLDLTEHLLTLTGSPRTFEMSQQRIDALRYRAWGTFRHRPTELAGAWQEIDHMMEAFPDLVSSSHYITYLRDLASLAMGGANVALIRETERRMQRDLSSEHLTDEARSLMLRQVGTPLLAIFESHEELDARLSFMHRIEALDEDPGAGFYLSKMKLFEMSGRYLEAIEVIDRIVPRMHDQALWIGYFSSLSIRLSARMALGLDIDDAVDQARALCREAAPEAVERLPFEIGIRLAVIATLRAEPAAARAIISEFMSDRMPWSPVVTLLHLFEGDLAAALAAGDAPDMPWAGQLLIRYVATPTSVDLEELEHAMRAYLSTPPLRITDLTSLYIVYELFDRLAGDKRIRPLGVALEGELRTALPTAIEWLEERRLHPIIRPLLKRYGKWLTAEDRSRFESSIDRLAREEVAEKEEAQGRRYSISMIGRITIESPDEKVVLPRAGRVRTLLGALVADRMSQRRMSMRDLVEAIAIEGEEGDRTRKGINLAVHRLREALVHEAIVTSGETPELNMELLQVDLLDAAESLRECEEALRSRVLLRAQRALMKALDIIHGDVLFPGLYDDYFERAREEFDVRIRAAVVDLASLLLGEEEAESAERVLRRAYELMPGEEEIAELLRESLVRQGQRVEAERVRRELRVES